LKKKGGVPRRFGLLERSSGGGPGRKSPRVGRFGAFFSRPHGGNWAKLIKIVFGVRNTRSVRGASGEVRGI